MGTNLLLRTWVVTYNSYHFVRHCSAFYGLKKTNWRAEIYFSPLARSRNGSDYFLVILFCSYFLKALQSDDGNNTVYTLGRKF